MVDQDTNGRSQSSAWRDLHVEGILWDGPVSVVDGEHYLPLRMIATTQRLTFTRGGEFVLEIPRDWLNPQPYMNPDGSITIMIDAGEGARSERLRVIARDGRRLAVDLVAALNKFRPSRSDRTQQIYAPEPVEELAEPVTARGRGSIPTRTRPGGGLGAEPLEALDPDDFPPFSETPARSQQKPADDASTATIIIAETTMPARVNDWSLRPIVSMSSRTDRLARRGWAIRLSGLIALLMIAAAFGSGHMPALPGREFTAHIPDTSINAPFSEGDTTPTTAPVVAQWETPTPAPAPQPQKTPPSVAQAQPTLPPSETAVALGVGGMDATRAASTAVTAEPTSEPTQAPADTATPTETATLTSSPTETPAPTEAAIAPAGETVAGEPDPTATPSPAPEPTLEPTAEPTLEPTQTPVPEPTALPTLAPTATSESVQATEPVPPTEPVATTEPTLVPTETATLTPEPTATASPTAEPSPTPSPTERPSFPVQGATLEQGELPAQAFTAGKFRYTVESVVRAAQIGDLALTPVLGTEWVVVLLHAENWSSDNATLSVGNLQLLTYGAYGVIDVPPDPVSQVIARTLNLQPAMGASDSTLMAPGDGQRLALVYLIRPDTTELQLTTGVTTIDLAPSMGRAISITDPGDAPTQPELMPVTVLQVLDGQSILVETEEGARARVRYLGVQAPLSTACFAAESKAANAELVDGKTVYLERERKNRAPNSRISRDVWIEGADGNLTLVAAELAARGAVVAAPVEPDVRFAGWIEAASDTAFFSGSGLWGACGGLQTPVP